MRFLPVYNSHMVRLVGYGIRVCRTVESFRFHIWLCSVEMSKPSYVWSDGTWANQGGT